MTVKQNELRLEIYIINYWSNTKNIKEVPEVFLEFQTWLEVRFI